MHLDKLNQLEQNNIILLQKDNDICYYAKLKHGVFVDYTFRIPNLFECSDSLLVHLFNKIMSSESNIKVFMKNARKAKTFGDTAVKYSVDNLLNKYHHHFKIISISKLIKDSRNFNVISHKFILNKPVILLYLHNDEAVCARFNYPHTKFITDTFSLPLLNGIRVSGMSLKSFYNSLFDGINKNIASSPEDASYFKHIAVQQLQSQSKLVSSIKHIYHKYHTFKIVKVRDLIQHPKNFNLDFVRINKHVAKDKLENLYKSSISTNYLKAVNSLITDTDSECQKINTSKIVIMPTITTHLKNLLILLNNCYQQNMYINDINTIIKRAYHQSQKYQSVHKEYILADIMADLHDANVILHVSFITFLNKNY